MEENILFEVSGVDKKYGTANVLNDIDLYVKKGEVIYPFELVKQKITGDIENLYNLIQI